MIFIGLGSNQGDPVEHLVRAIRSMPEKGVIPIRLSSLYHTPAWGIKDQSDFANAVAEVSFEGSAEALLDILLEIEQDMGRTRIQKWGPRLIDLDILEFRRFQIQSERLQIPHPWYHRRAFVMVPLQELEPDWIPTAQHKSLTQLLSLLPEHELQIAPIAHEEWHKLV
ncbi:MAG: 2-amino-4-hydroxy-6-hydroxymethyldihydropteridine diphosphokinase [Bacteroidota bacterium]